MRNVRRPPTETGESKRLASEVRANISISIRSDVLLAVRGRLWVEAKTAGKPAKDHRIDAGNRQNTREALAGWLHPYLKNGTLARFPFATGFTQTEQRLLPALSMLKSSARSKRRLLSIAASGLLRPVSRGENEILKRMGLDAPGGPREQGLALLSKGALRHSGDDIPDN